MGWAIMTEEYLKSQGDEKCSYCGERVNPGDAFYIDEKNKLIHRGCAWEKEESKV
ncbi:MAG: hypothetical protein ACE5K3_00960 [bacterium]